MLWRTRLRLALWSGGTTLVVLLLLGIVVYAFVAGQIARDSEEQLRARATLVAELKDAAVEPADPEAVGLVAAAERAGVLFGGPLSGTIAVTVETEVGPLEEKPAGLPQAAGAEVDAVAVKALGSKEASAAVYERISRAVSTSDDHIEDLKVSLKDIDGVPMRIVSVPAGTREAPLVVHALADRTIELRTLTNLASAMLVGGLLAVIAAALAGWAYSGRALVPIRASMQRQREFAADASHELRTPLTVVRSNLEFLARRAGDDPDGRVALNDATAETEHMARLIDDLLLLARTDADAAPIEDEAVDLAEAALVAVQGLADRAERRRVRVELDLSPTSVLGDAGRLRQLVTILVGNAITHGREGGHVWVSVAPGAGCATLMVADDGPGIALEHRDRVFERFWRGPSGASGSGLGLAIAGWIVDAHGGAITLDDRPSGGACFRVELPG